MNNIKFNNIIFKLYSNILSSYNLSEDLLVHIYEFLIDYNKINNLITIIFEKKDRITKESLKGRKKNCWKRQKMKRQNNFTIRHLIFK